MTSTLKKVFKFSWFPVSIVGVWQLLTSLSSSPFFPTPLEIAYDFFGFWEVKNIAQYLLPTIRVLAAGFLFGGGIGLVAGVFAGAGSISYRVLIPLGTFARGIPTAALLPVVIGISGLGPETLLYAVVFSVATNVFVATAIGISRVQRVHLEQAKLLGLSFLELVLRIRFPAAAGDVLVGLQAALQSAIVAVVLGEILFSPGGIGGFLRQSQELFSITQMWVGILLLGIVGTLANEAFMSLERRLVPWYFSTRGGHSE